MSNESDYGDIANALAIWPPEALAQEAGPQRAPSYAIVRDLRGTEIQGGRWTYRICKAFDNDVLTVETKCHERLTILLKRAEWGGRPAWLVSREVSWRRDTTDQWGSADTKPFDTTYADARTLRPVYYALIGDRIRVVHQFIWDTVYEAVDIGGPHPRSWRGHAVIPGAVDAPLVLRWRWLDLDLLLQALPLTRDWRGSVYSVGLVSRDPSKAAIEPLDLRVAGGERIEVPAGTFECWKIVGRDHRDVTLTWWVSKHGGWLVKMVERGPDWLTERALVTTSRPPL